MASSGAMWTTTIAVVAGTATLALVSAARRRPYVPGGLARYEPRSRDPLRRPLRHGLAGVQLPVWPGAGGELYVGHGEPRRPHPRGADTLRRGVLEPLLRRVAATGGHIHPGCTEPFELLIELPGDEAAPERALRAYQLLDACLRDHAAILTRWSPAGVVPGPVTVTITGRLSALHLLADADDRWACVDGTLEDLGSAEAPPALAPLVSEHWSWRFGWDGLGPMPPEERHLLHWLVREAHAEGRRVRFLGIPERPRRVRAAFWTELTAAGVDFIDSRKVRALARHLGRCRRPVPGIEPVPAMEPGAADAADAAPVVRPPTPSVTA